MKATLVKSCNYAVLILMGIVVGGIFEFCFLKLSDRSVYSSDLHSGISGKLMMNFGVQKQNKTIELNSFIHTPLKLLCIIRIVDDDDLRRLNISLNTWVPRCPHHIVVSDYMVGIQSSFVLRRDWTEWTRIREIWRFIHNKFRDDFNLFLLTHAKFEAYILVENLVNYVNNMRMKSKSQVGPFILSHMLVEDGYPYPSAKPAIVLNKSAVIRLANRLDYNEGLCKLLSWQSHSMTFARCLLYVGVKFIDARDEFGRLLFLPLTLGVFLNSNASVMSTLSHDYVNKVQTGSRCCSDHPIAFTGNGYNMYTLEFFTYHFNLSLLSQRQNRVSDNSDSDLGSTSTEWNSSDPVKWSTTERTSSNPEQQSPIEQNFSVFRSSSPPSTTEIKNSTTNIRTLPTI